MPPPEPPLLVPGCFSRVLGPGGSRPLEPPALSRNPLPLVRRGAPPGHPPNKLICAAANILTNAPTLRIFSYNFSRLRSLNLQEQTRKAKPRMTFRPFPSAPLYAPYHRQGAVPLFSGADSEERPAEVWRSDSEPHFW